MENWISQRLVYVDIDIDHVFKITPRFAAGCAHGGGGSRVAACYRYRAAKIATRQKSQQNILLTFHAQNTIACEMGASTPQH